MNWYTPPCVAEKLGVNAETVRNWIVSEELRAINLSNSSRPRWRISEEDFQDFCNRRANISFKKKNPRQPFGKRRKKAAAIEFFK